MCGRFSFSTSQDIITEKYGLEYYTATYKPRFNCAPSQNLAVITNLEPKVMNYFRWGLVPYWAKDPSIGNRMINAKAETIGEKPSFRQAFLKRRCLVPADGFFEWKKDKDRMPYFIHLKGRVPFAFAGLWEAWRDAEGKVLNSFTIITTEPNVLMKEIHLRMPVILSPEAEKLWVTSNDPAVLQPLLKPFPEGEMEAYPVSKLVNSPLYDEPALIEPLWR